VPRPPLAGHPSCGVVCLSPHYPPPGERNHAGQCAPVAREPVGMCEVEQLRLNQEQMGDPVTWQPGLTLVAADNGACRQVIDGCIPLRGSTIRRTVPLRTCCPAVPPTLCQAPPSRHHEKYRREPLAYVRVSADWLLSSVPRTTWRPCSTSGRRRTPDRHRGPEGLAEARCRTRSTGLPPMAGAGCAA
jgi:hypothetical protein